MSCLFNLAVCTDSWANSACPAHFARACSHSYSPSAQIRPSILAPRPSIANMPLAGSGLPPCGAMAQSSPGGRCRHTRPRMAARATSSEPNTPLRQTASLDASPNVPPAILCDPFPWACTNSYHYKYFLFPRVACASHLRHTDRRPRRDGKVLRRCTAGRLARANDLNHNIMFNANPRETTN